jgi:hypothetical protein
MGNSSSRTPDYNRISEDRYKQQLQDIKKGSTDLTDKLTAINTKYEENKKNIQDIDSKVNDVYSKLGETNDTTTKDKRKHQGNVYIIDDTHHQIIETNNKISIEGDFESKLREIIEEDIDGINVAQKRAVYLSKQNDETKRKRNIQYSKYFSLIQAENEKIVETQRNLDDYLMMGHKQYSLEDEVNMTMQYYLFGLLCVYYLCVVVFLYFYIVSGPFPDIEDWYIRYVIYVLVGAVFLLYPFIIYTIEKYTIQYSYWVYCFCFNEVYGLLSIFPR